MPCPKCGTELVVPDPSTLGTDEAPPSVAPASIDEPAGASLERFDSEPMGSSIFERIDLKIEELRVEPEPAPRIKEPERGRSPALAGASRSTEPTRLDTQIEKDAEPSAEALPALPSSVPDPRQVSTEPSRSQTSPAPASGNSTHFVAPTVVIRARDVVVPRVVMFAWSLTVLAGIGMAFIAGLMVGHYLWTRRS
jgi:hypothetical protein